MKNMNPPEINRPPATLSVIIITKNEAHDIGDCIRSVRGLAHEVIVLDSGSTDGTRQLCRQLGATVFETIDWPGFGPQKNRALDKAAGDWVLSLDADERAGDELKREIGRILRDGSDRDGFQMPRKSSFCGRFMMHSGWWPDYNIRLFKRGRGRFSNSPVHEKIEVAGVVGTLRGFIIHFSIGELAESIEKLNAYSTAGAGSLKKRGRRGSLAQALAHGFWTFFRVYIIKLGFLDGRHGLLLAKLNADGAFYKYAKLAFGNSRQENKKTKEVHL
jgi:glycosyltransferase involved in cell wall biosynthesis